jgi:hypothetical protein
MDKKKFSIVTGAALAFFSTGVIQADLAATQDLTGSTLVANHDGKEGGCSGKEGGCSGKESGCSGKDATREGQGKKHGQKHDQKHEKAHEKKHTAEKSEKKSEGEAPAPHAE